MLEFIKIQTPSLRQNRISQTGCEVSQFMRNFFDAARAGNLEEISTYYADDIDPFEFPLNADWIDEIILVDDHLATVTCSLRAEGNTELQLKCVLDKSEGYWQIIHGEIRDEKLKH